MRRHSLDHAHGRVPGRALGRALHALPRALLAAALLASAPARAAEADEDWRLFGNVLALVQQFVRVAAAAPDADTAQKGVDGVMAGRNAEANRAAGEVLAEVLRELPAEQRGTFTAIARDVLTIARRENQRAPLERQAQGALQARKDLHAMGLRYWDEQQYQEAVRRGDRIAVELYLAGQGLPARTPR
jgi:hypothetical protein